MILKSNTSWNTDGEYDENDIYTSEDQDDNFNCE